MVKITLELVRKRSEHNDGELSTLEELSLHQMDVEKMEHLHRWCPNLRILYLQGNLIAKIENVGRLRGLEYLNLALNNLESVSGLERCEALQKLDLTANFITHLTSLLTLQDLPNLTQLYMTGNPCTDYRGYRTWVLCNLWVLSELDGVKVTRGERLRALQDLTSAHTTVNKDQQEALERRAREKMKQQQQQQQQEGNDEVKDSDNDSDNEEKWWDGTSEHTPESRIATHRHIAARRHRHQQAREHTHNNTNKKKENTPRLFTTDGRPMNVNSANLQFKFTEDEQENTFVLDVNTYKYLDPSLVSCSVETWYVRVTVRGKILQLVLLEEVRPGQATARRSQVTGHLVITMPKLAPPPRWLQDSKCKQKISPVVSSITTTTTIPASAACHPLPPRDQLEKKGCVEYLEVDEERRGIDYTNIVKKDGDDVVMVVVPPSDTHLHYNLPPLRPNSPGFQDNSEVPPLE
ncbi:hypothetical protein Pmani_028120 [Petrolisthes manimaculis]|uniref:Dynein axonemal assembly factor 11-like CS domain-containing protein n=1 Tax=Petrolisthes manimaculis TaxID=1843537 RepID=A0AAE1P027_9EUCA|nr:hypothetical protein Pmani_028120 [Petrolisthes manimaculis]